MVECISDGQISRDMFDNMVPPSRGLEAVKDDNSAKIDDNRREDGWL
jgi:hypothetical protein